MAKLLFNLRNVPADEADEVRALLLVALYRLETRPDAVHTVVDQAVSAAAEIAGGNFRGLVNGVLRNFLRQQPDLTAAFAADAGAAAMHPDWWLAQLQAAYPKDWPAIVAAGNAPPPMGLRVRLKSSASVNNRIDDLSPAARVIAVAIREYGMILADNGSAWYVSGMSDPRFDDDVMHELDVFEGADLEVVDTSGLVNGP